MNSQYTHLLLTSSGDAACMNTIQYMFVTCRISWCSLQVGVKYKRGPQIFQSSLGVLMCMSCD